MTRLARLIGSAVLALFLFSSAWADVSFDTAPLSIVTKNGKVHTFTVELAVDGNQRSQGLMNRREMADDRGMLFDFGMTREVMMWMKNTYLPLDMLFISKTGKIETVRENAVPQSEAIIDSRVPVAFVLELNAGTVARLGIAKGDTVTSQRIRETAP